MKPSSRFTLFSILMVFVLVFSLIAPITAFASDDPPVDPTPTAEPAADESAEAPAEAEAAAAETATEEAATEEAVTEEAVTEEAVTEEAVTEEAATEEAATEEATATEESAPAEETVAEVVQALAEAGAVLVDAEGEVIPLTSEQAIDALTAPDPIGCPAGVSPISWGGTGAGCTISYASIQDAINDASVTTGWTIYIDPGTFYENVQVTKSVTLQGSGQGVTIVKPAATGVITCQGSCPNATNSVIWVLADGVSIFDLTVDGDSDLLTSGVVVGGADIDAHNGIITNSNTNLTVENVTVENVYARGIQVGKSNATFDISNNTVNNVQGDFYSIGIFGYTSGGVIDGNTVSNVGDGIALNWSTGTQITNNTVNNAGSGIHTDNAQGADVIDNNTITSGKTNSYGIFVFAPYNNVTVSNNDISDVDYGLTLSGNGFGTPVHEITFDSNSVSANVAGAYITSDVWGYFKSNANARFTDNTISGSQYGFYLESQAAADYVPGYYGTSDCAGDCTVQVTLICNDVNGQIFQATGGVFWDGDLTANYNGVYIVDDSGNVCTVVTPPVGGGEDEEEDEDKTPATVIDTTGGVLIPVTGGETLTLDMSPEDLLAALEEVANDQFPLELVDGQYNFACVLTSVTTLAPDAYITVDDQVVTSVGQCSYLVDGEVQTLTIALSFLGATETFAPGSVMNVGMLEDDVFASFAGSGNPFDVNNFLVASTLASTGSVGN